MLESCNYTSQVPSKVKNSLGQELTNPFPCYFPAIGQLWDQYAE